MFMTSLAASCVVVGLASSGSSQEMPKPSEEHKILMQDVGEWTIKGKMLTPTGFQEFQGEEKVIAIGQFWTVSNYSSNAMGGLKGSSTIGFDPKAKRFVGTWVDSFMPSPTRMKGSYDQKTKTMTYETVGMGMDGKPMPGRIIVNYKTADTHIFTMMHQDPTGQTDELVKSIEMIYTRKKNKTAK